MKHPGSLLAISMIMLSFACRNHKQATDPKAEQVKKSYFPVIDFMKSEISYVDSTPLAILKYEIGDRQLDSAYIKPAAFDQLSQEFLAAELDSPYFEQHFSESSFFDETTKLVTFTYASKDSSRGLHR